MSRTRNDLDRSLVHGIAWTSAVTWFSQLLSWGATFFVLHKLEPKDYGLVGTALLCLGMVQMFSEFGVGSAVVRFQSLTRHQIEQFNSLSLMLGVGAAGLALLLAKPVSLFFPGGDELPKVMSVMSIGFIITGLRVVPQALMQRDLQFRQLALLEGIQSIAMAVSNISMALLGFGKWTLVMGPMIGATLMMVMVVSRNPIGFKRPNLEEIGQPFHFSKQIIQTRFMWWTYSNADFFIIRKTLGEIALGIYGTGWTFSGLAVEKITALVGRVTPAFFAAVQDNLADVRRYLLLLTEGLALMTFPVCVGLALVADDAVTFVLGEKWTLVVVPLCLLSLVACIRSIEPLAQQAMTAIGEARVNLNNSVLTVCVLPLGIYAGQAMGVYLSGEIPGSYAAIAYGINSVAVVWIIVGPLLSSRLLFTAMKRTGLPPREYFAALWPAVSSCITMSVVVLLLDASLPKGSLLFFIVKCAAGALAYAATLLLLHRDRVFMARDLVRTLRSGPRPTPAAGVEQIAEPRPPA